MSTDSPREQSMPALLDEACDLALVISGHFCENPDEWLRGHEHRLRELQRIARSSLRSETAPTQSGHEPAQSGHDDKKDAARYRWLAEYAWPHDWRKLAAFSYLDHHASKAQLDAAIDAAIRREELNNGPTNRA